MRHPASSIQYPVSSIQHPESVIQHPVFSIQNPSSSIQYSASNIQHPPSSLLLLFFSLMHRTLSSKPYFYPIIKLMEVNDIIGWIATAVTMLSFLSHKMLFLRVVNFIACAIWVVYGVLTGMNPVIVTNTVIGCIHIYWFYKNFDKIKTKTLH
jgi:uncharacterized protein with PQ loop repeat